MLLLIHTFNEVSDVIERAAEKSGMDPQRFHDEFYEFFLEHKD